MAMVIRYYGDDGKPIYVWPAPNSGKTTAQIVAQAVPVGKAWSLIDSASIPVDPDEFRATLNPFARAFFEALKFFPAPGYLHMLDRYSQMIAGLRTTEPYNSLVVWNDRIVQIIRLHPDMDAFATIFEVPPEQVDLACQAAMLLERPGPSTANAADVMALLTSNGITPVVPT
jgi:hypothetical protein